MRPWFRYTYTMASEVAPGNNIVDRKQQYTQHDRRKGHADLVQMLDEPDDVVRPRINSCLVTGINRVVQDTYQF